MLGVAQMAFVPFLVFKIVFGAAVGALSAPIALLAALGDRQQARALAGA